MICKIRGELSTPSPSRGVMDNWCDIWWSLGSGNHCQAWWWSVSGGLEALAGQYTNIHCDTARSLWMKFRENKSINSRALLWRNTLLLSDNSWSHNIRPMSHPTQSPTVTSSLHSQSGKITQSFRWSGSEILCSFLIPGGIKKGKKMITSVETFPRLLSLTTNHCDSANPPRLDGNTPGPKTSRFSAIYDKIWLTLEKCLWVCSADPCIWSVSMMAS